VMNSSLQDGAENAMSIRIGYLLPTRERIMAEQPQAAPLLELAERAERVSVPLRCPSWRARQRFAVRLEAGGGPVCHGDYSTARSHKRRRARSSRTGPIGGPLASLLRRNSSSSFSMSQVALLSLGGEKNRRCSAATWDPGERVLRSAAKGGTIRGSERTSEAGNQCIRIDIIGDRHRRRLLGVEE